ncbi:hypothetical protein N9F61_00030 [Akkermansiaceae bacterium]|nr:hypothetical protein [Akkermansiaceae bacterium]MDB4562853.1 hypothetical protein [Akkermansiaceae bacterium]
MDRDDVEADHDGRIQCAADEVAGVGVEDGEVVLGTVVGGLGDCDKALGFELGVDLVLRHVVEIEARLLEVGFPFPAGRSGPSR